MNMRIPMVDLRQQLAATRAVWEKNLDEMHQRMVYVLGPNVSSFEQEFAAAVESRFAVGVSSGTTALELCLRDAQVTGRVITSALTAPFTGVAIQAAGATPVFADIDPGTLLMDPEDAARRIGKRTEALLPVHLYGQACNLTALKKIAQANRLTMIQDACQAHGAKFAGASFHQFSSYVAYSFYPTKNLGCLGDGGAITTNSPAINKRLRMLRDGGRKQGEQVSTRVGINARLDEMQAAYLRAFLPHLGAWNKRRAALAAIYDQAFQGSSAVRPVQRINDSVNHLYVVRVETRDRLRAFLAKAGIASAIHYPVPLHLHPAFSGCRQKRGDLPHAESASRQILSLPLFPAMTFSQVEEVAAAVAKCCEG